MLDKEMRKDSKILLITGGSEVLSQTEVVRKINPEIGVRANGRSSASTDWSGNRICQHDLFRKLYETEQLNLSQVD
ncbi:MAG: hypothetical protein WBO24_14700 [Nitrospirales bacterium]